MGCERRHFLFFGNIWLCPFLWFPFVIVTQNYVQYMKVVIVCRWCEWVHLINETKQIQCVSPCTHCSTNACKSPIVHPHDVLYSRRTSVDLATTEKWEEYPVKEIIFFNHESIQTCKNILALTGYVPKHSTYVYTKEHLRLKIKQRVFKFNIAMYTVPFCPQNRYSLALLTNCFKNSSI
ncbi:unnamed protein product [Albugo candida]|uniref:Uncharacterized protein n=1 Tax=Albugo candida TaxID=65357 RepID=A0A024GVH7_9STRA|nr:unnamed protein product [Albugo candida]|eukprot:CCI50382.1 unnamed protein product [Albugo candida]